MPNKTVVGQYLDKLSPAAELCGAVNTIVNENGVLTGHITDGVGFVKNLEVNGVDVKGKKTVVLGAGGAATAIQVQLALDGASEVASSTTLMTSSTQEQSLQKKNLQHAAQNVK